MMRHFLCLYTQSICALPGSMMKRTLESALIAVPCLFERTSPALGGTLRRTVNIAPVARQAQPHLGAAPRTIKQSKARFFQSLSRMTGQRRLDRRHSTRRRPI